MNTKSCITIALLLMASLAAAGQTTMPTISPSATYTDSEGNEQTETSISESAPLAVTFKANAENTDGWTAHYEWHFYKEGSRDNPYLLRYEQETSYTFNEAGAHYVELWATFTQGSDSVNYTDEYWSSEGQPLTITISESKLEMPNAFSPNGDGINDVYKAKDGYQSLVEFQATIFNRWGQKLYSWTDPAGGWDGKFKGKDVAQGVYYVLVKAKGADGRKFNIRRDVNLLRGYTETTSTTN
ncbi:MAG: gliding motility-associated C-terminal domain-containing protein [Prevotella sp.]|nr:gliding motility-associated C-terminal domain-containing protein [Prevotella sp.]